MTPRSGGQNPERLHFRAAPRLRSLGGVLKCKREGSDLQGEEAFLYFLGGALKCKREGSDAQAEGAFLSSERRSHRDPNRIS